MKTLGALVFAFAGFVLFSIGFYYGRECNDTANYEAACLQADFIRYTMDHFNGTTECANVGAEIEECYYEFFTDMENLNTKYITNVKDFDQYGWCY